MSTPISDQDVSAITEMFIDRWIKTCLDRDWGEFLKLLTDDVVFMPPDESIVEGKDAVRLWMEKFPTIKAFTSQLIHVEGRDDFACCRGTMNLSLEGEGGVVLPMKGKWFGSVRKQPDGSWLCASDIWNLDEPMTAG